MSAVFIARNAPVKTKEQKRVSRVAIRVNKAVREARRNGPVVVYAGNGATVPVKPDEMSYGKFLMGWQ
jgi:hypothetical protein